MVTYFVVGVLSESGRCKTTPNATMKITATSHKTSQIECSKIEKNYIESTWYFLSHCTLLLRVASLSLNSPTKIMRTDPSLSSRYEMQFTLQESAQFCSRSIPATKLRGFFWRPHPFNFIHIYSMIFKVGLWTSQSFSRVFTFISSLCCVACYLWHGALSCYKISP